jgi:general secretion pathway protein D
MEPSSPASAPQGQTPPPVELEPQAISQAEPSVAPAPAPGHPALIPPGMADELVQVNFEEVDIRTVLKTIGEITGINFIPHKSVSGTVTVMSPTPIRLGDIYGFLQSILDVHGYAAIETENAVKIVPKDEATKRNLQVRIGADPAFIPKNDAMVTQILPLKYAQTAEIGEIIKPLLSTGAQMTTYPRTN